MNRTGNLFEKICDIQNLHEAYYKAAKSKHLSSDVINFNQNYEKNLESLRLSLVEGSYKHGKYRQFTIIDSKERIISAASFKDRIVHHSIINILEPLFERQFIFHTYACRKYKGTHAAALYAYRKAKSCRYFLKLDVRKYFDSIDHSILKKFLCRIIKDSRCISLLFNIIDSYEVSAGKSSSSGEKGLPIGNLTSQFFANYYLSCLDHFVLEQLKPCGYVRYMDDIIIFENSLCRLKQIFYSVNIFCLNQLLVALKTPVFGRCNNGVPFLGWKLSSFDIKILGGTKRRMRRVLARIFFEQSMGKISAEKAQARIESVYAARRLRNCKKSKKNRLNLLS